jgi:hypothetical protein
MFERNAAGKIELWQRVADAFNALCMRFDSNPPCKARALFEKAVCSRSCKVLLQGHDTSVREDVKSV